MDEINSNYSPESKYLLNFSFSQRRLSSLDNVDQLDDLSLNQVNNQFNNSNSISCMSSNVISETSLEENFIMLRKKSLLKRKSMGSIKIFYSEIIDLKLRKSDLSNLYSSIEILYSKNGYSKHLISLSSSDGFAVRWFYDELVVRHSLFKSNLNKKTFNFDEKRYVEKVTEDFNENLDDNDKSSESTLDDFMNQMNAEISQKRKREIEKQMKFDRCSNGEY